MFQEEVGQGCEWAFVYLAYVFFKKAYIAHTHTHVWVCTECSLAQESLNFSCFTLQVYTTKMGLNSYKILVYLSCSVFSVVDKDLGV